MKKFVSTLTLVAALALVSGSAQAATQIISLSFGGVNKNTLDSGDITGAVPAGNFNNFVVPAGAYRGYPGNDPIGTPISLNDSTGGGSAVTLNSYYTGTDGGSGVTLGGTPTAQEKLFNGGLNNNFGPGGFTLSGLSAFTSYDLYVYFDAYAFGAGRNATLAIGTWTNGGDRPSGSDTFIASQSFYTRGISTETTAYTQSTNTTYFDTTAASPPSVPSSAVGNYVVFSGLTANSETIAYYLNNNNVNLAGVQIVGITAVPEPSTYALLFAGGCVLFVLRRKRSNSAA